jgi:hypothetical protein
MISMKLPLKRVWFHHFHKCMGTSIVRLMAQCGYKFFPGSPAGNDFQSEFHGGYTPVNINRLVRTSAEQEITALASEHSMPDVYHPDLFIYFTILRSPYQRFISNYHYDMQYRGNAPLMTVVEYYNDQARDNYTKANYYLDMLSHSTGNIDIALENLKNFEIIAIQERSESWYLLSTIGIQIEKMERNNAVKRVLDVPSEFKTIFMRENKSDFIIYNKAVEISQEMMKNTPNPDCN